MAAHLSPTSFAACQTWQPTISGGLVDIRITRWSTAGSKKPMPDFESSRAAYSSCSDAGAWAGRNMNDAGFGLQWLPVVKARRTSMRLQGSINAGRAHKSALRHIGLFSPLLASHAASVQHCSFYILPLTAVHYLVCLSPTWIIHYSHIGCTLLLVEYLPARDVAWQGTGSQPGYYMQASSGLRVPSPVGSGL